MVVRRLVVCCGVLLALLAGATTAEETGGASWTVFLNGVKRDAMAAGVAPEVLNGALGALEPDPRVLGFDRKQPEFVQTMEQYLNARVTESRISAARRHFVEHRELLDRIGERYGVDPQFIVAFWGVESSFGRYQGKYSIVRSVATLAHDQRRSAFFRKELLHALAILDEGHVPLERFVGGWAGAMGQNQFMPSSFRRYAQDFDGDGRKDIWQNRADVWASIAYYLAEYKWREGEPWGFRVALPEAFLFERVARSDSVARCRAERSHSAPADLATWRARGFDVPVGAASMRLLKPERGADHSYMAAANFEVILRYNCANKYAISVGLLADAIIVK